MQRLGLSAAVLVAVVAGVFALTAALIDRDALQRSVETQIRAVTGLDLVIAGPIEVSIFPSSHVAFRDARLKGGGDEPALTVATLTANLRLLPLLMRRFEIADLVLTQPAINVVRGADGESNWTPFIHTVTRTLKPGASEAPSFSEIRIVDGALSFRDETSQWRERLADIDLSLAWPAISRSFAATGQFDWRGERIDGSIAISDFLAALSGERSGLKLRLAAQPLKIAFDGALANRASLTLEGTLSADSASLRNALRWTGHEPPGSGGFGRFALKARASMVGSQLALSNVNVEVDKNVAEGVMTFTTIGRPSFQATLAAGELDVTPYLSTVRLLASGARDWNRQLFELGALNATDFDMRLSAAKVTIGASTLGRTAIGANLRGGVLALSIGEAQIYGGVMRGSLGVTRADASADVKAQFQFTDVDLQACTADLFGINKLTGRGNLALALEASGSSPFALAQSLDGSATLTGRNGAISGFNVEQLLKRLERRPLSGGGNFRSGQTPFDSLTVSLRFADGVATAQDVRVEGPTTRMTLTGTASVPAREFDMKGVASLTAGGAGGFELPFVVQGPWDDPLIFPDPESLIRRSPASAPLLDAVKDRRARDAVRSVLERFTGQRAAPEAQDAPAATEPKAN